MLALLPLVLKVIFGWKEDYSLLRKKITFRVTQRPSLGPREGDTLSSTQGST